MEIDELNHIYVEGYVMEKQSKYKHNSKQKKKEGLIRIPKGEISPTFLICWKLKMPILSTNQFCEELSI